MPELHLYDPIVKKYSACGPFTKHAKRIQEFMQDGRLSHIYKNELGKACFQHDTITQSDIVLTQIMMVLKELRLVWFGNFSTKNLKHLV